MPQQKICKGGPGPCWPALKSCTQLPYTQEQPPQAAGLEKLKDGAGTGDAAKSRGHGGAETDDWPKGLSNDAIKL